MTPETEEVRMLPQRRQNGKGEKQQIVATENTTTLERELTGAKTGNNKSNTDK